MAVPAIVNDGDFTTPRQNGAPEPDFPFSYRGDFKTFVAKVTMRVDVDSYKVPQQMAQRWFPGLGRGYLVDFTSPNMVGQRVLEYNLVYASVPLDSTEYNSATYSAQLWSPPLVEGGDYSITTATDTYDAQFVYEYSIFKPLPQILYTRLVLIPAPATATFPGQLIIQVQGSPVFARQSSGVVDVPGRALARNTTSKIWKGRIYERLSVYINYQAPVPLITVGA